MSYLPILQELFQSDSVIFMLIGLVFTIFACTKIKNMKAFIIGFASSFVVYGICEAVSNFHTHYIFELVLLIIGTIAIGGIIGFLGAIFVRFLRE